MPAGNHPGILRMLDANLNRASEGLRAAEDVLRFVRGDAKLSRAAREIRHSLTAVVGRAVPRRRLVAARDSQGDPGRGRWAGRRGSAGDVLSANLRRAQESARVIEEGLRIVSRGRAVASMQAIRYRLYALESATQARKRPTAARGR